MLLASHECQKVRGGVSRVMSLILSQLMQRSPSHTLEHLAKPLLHPLVSLTRTGPAVSCDSGQASGCISDVNCSSSSSVCSEHSDKTRSTVDTTSIALSESESAHSTDVEPSASVVTSCGRNAPRCCGSCQSRETMTPASQSSGYDQEDRSSLNSDSEDSEDSRQGSRRFDPITHRDIWPDTK